MLRDLRYAPPAINRSGMRTRGIRVIVGVVPGPAWPRRGRGVRLEGVSVIETSLDLCAGSQVGGVAGRPSSVQGIVAGHPLTHTDRGVFCVERSSQFPRGGL